MDGEYGFDNNNNTNSISEPLSLESALLLDEESNTFGSKNNTVLTKYEIIFETFDQTHDTPANNTNDDESDNESSTSETIPGLIQYNQ